MIFLYIIGTWYGLYLLCKFIIDKQADDDSRLRLSGYDGWLLMPVYVFYFWAGLPFTLIEYHIKKLIKRHIKHE